MRSATRMARFCCSLTWSVSLRGCQEETCAKGSKFLPQIRSLDGANSRYEGGSQHAPYILEATITAEAHIGELAIGDLDSSDLRTLYIG